ncbi:hypothetical protein EDC18_10679 [Natranaerovirga pectinivora]|uniref:Uncharacterized protein n=1 Tax=Natranaerovirga pectinivora TaxID=682400 RepID=A0A4R3ML52_9FIRM|nr:hypothetical protein [Natranaerovirga pectinivora]TCT14282.1 hypothetical protein EDC18_10679 [Natranaerovirga pectinivora]
MINFDEEIKKFKPCLEIEDTEDSVYNYDSKDISDILQEILKEMKNTN